MSATNFRVGDRVRVLHLNAEAQAKGIDAWSLFQGPEARAQRWASEELRDHWRTHPRVTFAQYEREQSYRMEEW